MYTDAMKAGIIGGSGYTGVELLRLLAGHPDIEVATVTAHSRAGQLVGEYTPSLAAAYPGMVYEAADPNSLDAFDGLDLVFCALPHGESQRIVPALRERVGVIVDLAADFRLRDPALYPTWYGEAHEAPAPSRPGRLRAAGAVPRLAGRGHARRLGRLLPDGGRAGAGAARAGRAGRAERDHRRCRLGHLGGRAGRHRLPALRDGRRELRGLRPADPSPHARDAADPGRGGALHAASRPHGPRDPGHVLRPPRRSAAEGARALSTADVMDALHARLRPRALRRGHRCAPVDEGHRRARTAPTSRRGWTSAPAGCCALCALDNLVKGASGQAVQCANVALGLPETTGLPTAGLYP